MLYKIDKNPDWNVFLNMAQEANLTDKSGKEQQSVRIHKKPSPTLPSLLIHFLFSPPLSPQGLRARSRRSGGCGCCGSNDPLVLLLLLLLLLEQLGIGQLLTWGKLPTEPGDGAGS